MFAIIQTGGKQYRVQPGDTIEVERLEGEPGATLDLAHVLMVGGDGDTRVAPDALAGAVVKAEVLDHKRGEKIIVFRFKSKVRYRRKTGHRQSLTRLRITDIALEEARQATRGAGTRARTQKAATPTPDPTPTIGEAAPAGATEA